ncbi:Zinc knuckle CX2CX4HX4C [Parasponia andersonii]|uniref:Zinc knuckle CX2CX4HX4C n=1 Tax=Parasponia andersonii TaxID=3476 RepID=A0A2P5A5H3_PARAD|nr:Zinc knuckle CX2CX4HX4C [Parasponia andersonii]
MTLNGEFGHFACILIDIDLSQPIFDSLMVEVGSDYFFISLEYEHLPAFCSSCKTIGHLASSYRHGQPVVAAKTGEQKIERGRSRSQKRIYRPIAKSPNVAEVPVANAFSTLKKDLGPKEGVEEKGKKEFWADEEAVNDEDLILPKYVNASHDDSDNAKSLITKTAHLEEGFHVDATTVLPDQQNESKDSSSFEESKNDSLNNRDLSPSKVVSNVATRRSLKNLCVRHRPDILCLAETMYLFSSIPIRFLKSLRLDLVTVNDKSLPSI